jgi:hypothetical protein
MQDIPTESTTSRNYSKNSARLVRTHPCEQQSGDCLLQPVEWPVPSLIQNLTGEEEQTKYSINVPSHLVFNISVTIFHVH